MPRSSPSIALRDTKQVVHLGPVSGLAKGVQSGTTTQRQTGAGTCAFPCRVNYTVAQWLTANSLIRLPLRGQRRSGLCRQRAPTKNAPTSRLNPTIKMPSNTQGNATPAV